MNDLARIRAMFSKYPRSDEYNTYYKIVKIGKFTVIYLMTDDSYCNAELWFDKNGNFRGFYDPDFNGKEDDEDQRQQPRPIQMLNI